MGGRLGMTAPTAAISDMVARLRREDDVLQRDDISPKAKDIIISRAPEEERLSPSAVHKLRLRDFARASGGWSWSLDDRGCLSTVSEQITAILGRRAAEFVGQPLEVMGRLCPNRDGVLPLVAARKAGEAFREQIFIMKDAKGTEQLFYLSGLPTLDKDGAVKGYRGTAITQSPSEHMKKTGTEAPPPQNAFLSNVSHELRTPLNAILGFTETMRMEMFGELSERYRHYCDDIMNAGQHLLALIDDMLDASQIEKNGSLTLNICPVIVADVVSEAKALIGAQALEQGVAIDEKAINLTFKLLGDRRRVKQILVNLLSNAVKYTGSGGDAGIDVTEDDGFICVTIWDTGPGIDQKAQSQIFERFERAGEGGYSGTQKGVGLGLHISKALAWQMGGDITVESEVGVGSRFTLKLPSVD